MDKRIYRVKWNGPAHIVEGTKGMEREGVTDEGVDFRMVYDYSSTPGGISRLLLDSVPIWSGYCLDALTSIAKNPNIATFKIEEVGA